MKIIAKGKQIIKAKQVNKFNNEEKQQQVESSSSSSDSDDSPKYIPANHDEGPIVVKVIILLRIVATVPEI